MRVVFLYVSDGGAGPGTIKEFDDTVESKNKFIEGFKTEGFYYLFKRMLEKGIIDDILILIESNRSPGFADFGGMKGYVIPEIRYIHQYIKEDDIIFVRGGFRAWFVELEKLNAKKHWLLLYAANTGRERWLFWDVMFIDLAKRYFIDRRRRFHHYWVKPIHPMIFNPRLMPIEYDICIGASFIHDKKGQFRAVNAVAEYEQMYGEKLKCVMPGAFRHSTHTNQILSTVDKYELKIDMPGMVSRDRLAVIFNQSKIFAHLGASGQNDRGPLEAMACGLPLIIGSPKYHSPIVYENKEVTLVPKSLDNSRDIARCYRLLLSDENNVSDARSHVLRHYNEHSSLENIIVPSMKRLFSVFRTNPKSDIEALRKEYVDILE